MVLVAVAGGSSPTLGRAIVGAILVTGKHEVLILSRKPEQDDVSCASMTYAKHHGTTSSTDDPASHRSPAVNTALPSNMSRTTPSTA